MWGENTKTFALISSLKHKALLSIQNQSHNSCSQQLIVFKIYLLCLRVRVCACMRARSSYTDPSLARSTPPQTRSRELTIDPCKRTAHAHTARAHTRIYHPPSGGESGLLRLTAPHCPCAVVCQLCLPPSL